MLEFYVRENHEKGFALKVHIFVPWELPAPVEFGFGYKPPVALEERYTTG